MKTTIDESNILRYNRQIALSQFDIDGQEKLLNSSVLIIGLGGLGCACSQYLAAAGVGKMTLVDDDLVELSNLQRQVLHTESDIGKSKVQSAYETLVALNSELEYQKIEKRLSETEMQQQISDHDLVVDCSDNLTTREQINRICWQENTILVSGAAIRMEGQVLSVQPKSGGACYACISHLFGEQMLSCNESGILSPVVGVIGASQALLTIKLITGLGAPLVGKLQIYDASEMAWNCFNVPKNPTCTICSNRD